jgi:hypothetical protein
LNRSDQLRATAPAHADRADDRPTAALYFLCFRHQAIARPGGFDEGDVQVQRDRGLSVGLLAKAMSVQANTRPSWGMP